MEVQVDPKKLKEGSFFLLFLSLSDAIKSPADVGYALQDVARSLQTGILKGDITDPDGVTVGKFHYAPKQGL